MVFAALAAGVYGFELDREDLWYHVGQRLPRIRPVRLPDHSVNCGG
jgi:hypothetical protein